MDRIIRHITGQLVDLLPDNQPHYRLEELRSWGFPDFIIRRVQVELERNLAESMSLPRTDWANMESPAIKTIWSRFVDAIRQEARLPASYAHTVIETTVADTLDILVHPRKNLPEVIFGADRELTYDQITGRLDAIVVYRHFAALIPRYMQKKELQKLTKERCTEIITRVDERLTKRYSPLNWAQMLDPLFVLLDQQIDTNLLRLFFEDKQMPRIARQFDELNSTVDRAQFIEVLSSPDSLDMEGYEDSQSELFKKDDQQVRSAKQEEAKEYESSSGEKNNNNGPEKRSKKNKKYPDSGHTAQTDDSEEDPIVGAFHDFRRSLDDREEESEGTYASDTTYYAEDQPDTSGSKEVSSLNDIFGEADEGDEGDIREYEDPEDNGTEPAERAEVTDEFNGTETGAVLPDREDVYEGTEDEDSLTIHAADTNETDTDDKEETPMWMRFLSPEELADLEEQDTEERLDEDESDGEPFIGSAEASETPGDDAYRLKNLLKDERNFFVKEIFRGSERAYDETMIEIAQKKDWRSASKYIEQNVFKKNLVDMYSAAAVDFTDRLHTYFLKKS